MEEQVGEIALRTAKAQGLVISRVPMPTRDAFIELADAEFAGDYGLTLKYLFDNLILLKMFFENTEYKLDEILRKLDGKIIKEKEPSKDMNTHQKKITLLSGRELKCKEEK